jgi:uncharacterized protein (TIGR02145 family)
MKRYITLVLSLLLLISVIKTNGQILITSSDSISLEQDTVIKLILPEYRGNLSWELSLDKKNWVSLNIESDSLNINLDTEAYYRAKIVDGACAAYFSDTIKIDTDSIETDSNSTTIEMAYPDSVGLIKEFIVNNDTIFCNKIDNKYVFQGDIILTEKQLQIDSLKGATLTKYKLWPNNTVYYIIDNNLDSNGEVLQAINHWKEKTTLNFIEWTGQENYISFKLGDGTYSNLGMIGGQQEISIASNADLRMVIHEIGHAVGLIHEHSRAKRNDYIDIKWSNIKLNMWSNFIIEDRKNQISQYDDFDFYSVMLYPCYSDASVAKNPSKPIITKRDDTFWNSRSNLSQGDINTIKFLYPPINPTNTFTDSRDGKTYKTIKIGNQTWMAENLAFDTGNTCWEYENDEKNIATYGRLYSLSAAKNACPNGWHLPSDNEWEQLSLNINNTKGPYSKAGDGDDWNELGKHLKTATGWNENGNGTNDFGFSGLPGGHRTYAGKFEDIGYNGYWWSSDGKIRSLSFYFSFFLRGLENANAGLSIRCIQGEQQESEIKIGNFYQGGIIFYIDNTGQHGLVAAQTDQSTGINWYNGSYKTTGATGTAVGTGKSNTSAIVSALGNGDYAASLCSKLTLNGYDDWFLPGKEELNLLFQLSTEGKLNDYDYWSSTESGGTGFGSGAWYSSKYFSGYGTQNVSARVRAIRAF